MRPLLVGGDIDTGRPSKIMGMLADYFPVDTTLYNGHLPGTLNCHDLVIWAPNISNEQDKVYPKKDKGAIMIISKVIHDDRTEVDAVSRIFDFHANAVICIYKDLDSFKFKLIDALGHVWVETYDLKSLVNHIAAFYVWSKGQIRMSFVKDTMPWDRIHGEIQLPIPFVKMNTAVADKVESGLGARYFGNFSTRCMKLFPSQRWGADGYLFSPRNTDKHRLDEWDFVLVKPPYYYGDRMYSVDSPVQVMLYRQFSDINYMIHGHAYIKGGAWHSTDHYYPCGDLREVEEVAKIFRAGPRMCNLKNHGFLMAAKSLDDMANMIAETEFIQHSMLR